MADEVITVTDVAKQGVVIDTPPIALSPNIFTDVRNVRFKDGAIRKIEGELLLNTIVSDLTISGQTFGKVRYFAVWENPNRQPLGVYYLWVVDYVVNSVTVGQKVYIQDHTSVKRDITPYINNSTALATTTATQGTVGATTIAVASATGIVVGQYVKGEGVKAGAKVTAISGTTITISEGTVAVIASTTTVIFFEYYKGFNFTTTGWQHTLFTGGFAFILNNGLDKPHYILDTAGNVNIANIVLAELPGWDSYNVNQEPITATWETGLASTFDLGQKVDFEVNLIEITVAASSKTIEAGTPAGTGTVGAANFVPGELPATLPSVTSSKFQVYTDTNTNTTVCYIGGLSDTNLVSVKIVSRNVVTVTCGILRSFGDLLVAGNLTETDSTSNTIVRRLSGVVRTSDVAVPGSVPNNWNPFAAGVSTADEFTLSETNVIKDMQSIQGNMYIYSTDSIHAMKLTGNASAPVSFSSVTDEYGLLTTGGVIEFDGRHFVIGGSDIYLFAGNPGDIKSLSDGKIRNYFFNNLNPIYEKRLFTLLNHRENEIWVCYPTLASLAGECNEALIYNYRDYTWTVRDLNSVTSGDIGPIRGGGIPIATLALTGNSGSAGYTNVGKKGIQTVTINGGTPKKTIGTKAIKTVSVGAFTTFTTDTSEVVDLTLTGNTGPTTVTAINTAVLPSASTFVYDREKATYSNGGATVTLVGNAGIPTVSFPAFRVLGTTQANGATITMTILAAAIKDYINSNFSLSDITATVNTNTITLTSDLPGPRTLASGTLFVGGAANAAIVVASTRTGIGVYGISNADSPAISMRITAPAVNNVQSAIDSTITLDKNLTSVTAIRNNLLLKLNAVSVFNGSSGSIYSSAINGNKVRLTSRLGGNHSPLTLAFSTSFGGTTYSETQFGGDLTGSSTVITAGAFNDAPKVTMTLTFPAGNASVKILGGTFSRANIVTELAALTDADSNWIGSTGTGLVTANAGAIGVQTSNFSVALTSTGSLPSGFANSTFNGAQTRAGRAAHSTTDTITLTPPTGYGNPITVNFNSTTAFNPDSGSAPTNVETITATEIATAIQGAFSDTTHFTIARAGAVLTFTSVLRKDIPTLFAYTVVNGASRTGTLVNPLISNANGVQSNAGIAQIFAKMTRVTITLQSTAGDQVLWDKHYGEGPGRLDDPAYTAAQDDNPFGDTGAANATAYRALFYNPEAPSNAVNGTVVNTLIAMQQALVKLSLNQLLLVTPNNVASPTSIVVSPSQFSSSANYVKSFSPKVQLVNASVAPTRSALVAAAEGATVAAGTPTQNTNGTDIKTTFDIIRPWSIDNINPNKSYPIFSQSGFNGSTVFNKIRAGDLGYLFGTTKYISYFEKQQMSVTPNFDTETVKTMALWADGGSVTTVGGEPQRATLQVRARGTNYPGENPFLTVEEDNTQTNAKRNRLVVNDFVIGSSYKVDTRTQGRLVNYRIDDAVKSTAVSYSANNDKAWNISGLQLVVTKGGDR